MRGTTRAATGAAILVLTALTGCTSHAATPPVAQSTRPDSGADGTSPVAVTRRDVQVRYKFDGTSQASSAVGVVLGPNTTLTPRFTDGDVVTAGAPFGDIVPDKELVTDLTRTAGTSTVDASRLAALTNPHAPVLAPITGRATRTPSGASIAAPGIDAVADITPLQVLRYRGLQVQGKASVETVYGQRVTPCDAVWIEQSTAPTGSAAAGAGGEDGAAPSAGRLHCRLSPTVETVPGLPLTIMLTSAPLKNVLAVPAIYVGLDKSGRNYVVSVLKDGRATQRAVTVGPTDGVVRVILGGITAGEQLAPIDPAS